MRTDFGDEHQSIWPYRTLIRRAALPITAGYVVRPAQPVLRPPPTPTRHTTHSRCPAWKCEGLSAGRLKRKAVPTSDLSLLGLIRHMAKVERSWFQSVIGGERITALWERAGDDHADLLREASDGSVGE